MPDSRGKRISRFSFATGETNWGIDVKDCWSLYVTSDCNRVISSAFRELKILDAATGEVIKEKAMPGGRIAASSDTWFAYRTDNKITVYDLDALEPQFRFGLGSSGQKIEVSEASLRFQLP